MSSTSSHALPKRVRREVHKEDKPIFRKTLTTDIRIATLREKAGTSVSAASQINSAYFVAREALQLCGAEGLIRQVLMTEPKSRLFQGRQQNPPYPLYHERTASDGIAYLALPRQFGVDVFGVPARVDAIAGMPVCLTALRPLLDAVTGPQRGKIDQETAVATAVAALRTRATRQGFAGGLFVLSCGFGKTCCAAHIIQRLGVRTLVVVPNEKPFVQQFAEEIRFFLGNDVRIGTLVTSNQRKWDVANKDIIFTTHRSVATIGYDLRGLDIGLVIVDEAHESMTKCYSEMYFRFHARYVVALTATPERANDHCGAYLQWLVGPVLWHEKRAAEGVCVTVYNVDYTGTGCPPRIVTLKDGSPYYEGMTKQLLARPGRDRFLIESVVLPRLRQGRRILVIGTRVEHMERFYRLLRERYGIDAGIIVGGHTAGFGLDAQAYAEALAQQVAHVEGRRAPLPPVLVPHTPDAAFRHAQQEKHVLVASAAIVSKALNIPQLDTLVVLSGGSYVNDTYWQQAIGRITRSHPDKQQPELVLIRDLLRGGGKGTLGADVRGGGPMAGMVDAACRTLQRLNPDGYDFWGVPVALGDQRVITQVGEARHGPPWVSLPAHQADDAVVKCEEQDDQEGQQTGITKATHTLSQLLGLRATVRGRL
jgi:superfamily II DNA or RNA helicase